MHAMPCVLSGPLDFSGCPNTWTASLVENSLDRWQILCLASLRDTSLIFCKLRVSFKAYSMEAGTPPQYRSCLCMRCLTIGFPRRFKDHSKLKVERFHPATLAACQSKTCGTTVPHNCTCPSSSHCQLSPLSSLNFFADCVAALIICL